MLARSSRWGLGFAVSLATAAGLAACGGSGGNATTSGNSGSGSGTGGKHTSSSASGGVGGSGGAGVGGSIGSFVSSVGAGGQDGGQTQGFDVEPTPLQTLMVPIGQTSPTQAYTATFNGASVNAGWTVDRGDVGSITSVPSGTGTFTPTGTTGGLVTIQAGLNGKTLQRQLMVQLAGTQNGSNPAIPGEAAQIASTLATLTAGGGIGGVGGEGLGPGVTDGPTLTALTTPTGDGTAQSLKLLYPYDKTVWPRGMLAPLLMWSWTTGDADAIQIQLKTTSGSFSWTGTFARPAILATTGGKFIRHPIPQDVWDMATSTAGGPTPNNVPDQLTVSLTVAKAGMAYGPISETWTVAPAHLAGTVYYNSYGTGLVKNSNGNDFNGKQYGAAVLSIQQGATGPTVVAGSPSGTNGAGCRVCHVVAANGSRLIVQHGDAYQRTSTYDLKNANAETSLNAYDSTFGWAGLSPDGALALTNTADLGTSSSASRLYTFPPTTATPLAAVGIPANLQAGAPTFSPDSKHVAFDFIGGTIGATTGNGTQLVALDFDLASLTFSNLKVLATMTGGKRAGFPSFFPTDDAVAFHYQIVNSNHRYNTWHQAQAQIWWSDLATGTAAPLSALNGLDAATTTSYLPTGPNNHADDTTLNYEPTVNPVVSGGYAWVVFTSRRLYGNLATQDPWLSDPRNYDATDYTKITDKKLWVAAVDIGSIQNGMFVQGWTPGSDPSHPAFYLPAQELVAGNARAFWVLDPCKPDGQTCATGDQCCNGYCEPGPGNAGLICANTPPGGACSMPQEKCVTAADCCDPTNLCINGFCSLKGVN